jgi:hypothetical protein
MSTVKDFFVVPQNSSMRWLLAAAAAVAAVAHIPVIGSHLKEAPYMGQLFIVLTAACFALALTALRFDTPAVYVASASTCSLAIIGYAATRLVAFPMLADDVGNWLEPLGVISVASEAIVVAASLLGLRRSLHTQRPLIRAHG